MIRIENATENNIAIIQGLAEKIWWPTYEKLLSEEQIRYMLSTLYSEENLLDVMRDGSQKFVLLYLDQIAIGFASYGKRTEDNTVYKLHKLYFLPEHQGKGLGRLLVNEIKTRLLCSGVHILELNVKRDNPAKKFYERLGFEVVGEEDIPFGPYLLQDYVMRIIF